ncbi:carbohydrate deacetylase [Paenibacillus lutimineralis]|uniref:ChbG/HpnK family deacetylase n=1 Tax=Paenibacillus lutimineralis TaxID=2707005 RepID=A0A3Q9ID69_9BACL|nr:ChbG/HpnK family deacetylase [Paenibacillus lutimineralis]AZS15485.1 ChbG/HpnK family deacetylase [Paenibacillus lutimineralis]
MKKYLIVNADDFGLTKSVSEGILYAHQQGLVTSTTAMMNREDIDIALKEAKKFKKLDIGVHLVFNKGFSLSKKQMISSLVDENGQFYKNLYELKETVNLEHLETEFSEQINKYIKITGEIPSHIDCHHWNVLYPPFFNVYIHVAQKFKLPLRSPLIDKNSMTLSQLQNLLGTVSATDLERNRSTLRVVIDKSGLYYPDQFISSFFGQNVTTKSFQNCLLNLEYGITEIMVHPGYNSEELEKESSYTDMREKEIEILTSEETIKLIQSENIQLVNFNEIENIKESEKSFV